MVRHRKLSLCFLVVVFLALIVICIACQPQGTIDQVEASGSAESESELGGSSQDIAIFDSDHNSSGLVLDHEGDVDVKIVVVGDPAEKAFLTGNGRTLPAQDGNTDPDCAMRFDVDDELIYAGEPTTKVKIEIEYLDDGTDTFNIQYDSLNGIGEDGNIFTDSEVVTKTGSGEFKTATIILDDAYFANRQYGGDFRIWDRFDGAETIRRVKVSIMDQDNLADNLPVSPERETTPSIVYYNGQVLTMVDDQVATAIEIQGDKIVAVGNDEEILAHAGSNSLQMDLQGKTLMPGFIDAHAHSFQNIWREDFEEGQEYLLSHGVTTSTEMFVDEGMLQDFLAFDQSEQLRMRISLYLLRNDNCGEDRTEWYWPDYPPSREDGALLQIPGVKIFNDGGSCSKQPARSFPYPDGGLGDLYHDAETLAGLILEAQGHGYQVAIHGLGDRAITVNLDALEMVLDGGPNTFHHRLEHNTLLTDGMFARFGKVDAVPVIFGFFPACFFSGDNDQYRYRTPEEYSQMEWAYRNLIDANPDVHFAWHSDSPAISPKPDPMINIYGFLTRREVQTDGTVCEPDAWAADDVLTIDEALEIMTMGSAYALRRDHEIGSLEPGKLADLIVLSDNPTTMDAESILDIKVLMTMVGGKVRYITPENTSIRP